MRFYQIYRRHWLTTHPISFITILMAVLVTAFLFGLSQRPTEPPLIINEVMSANVNGLADETGAFVDWIELYNQSDQPINLSGWSLSDDPTDLRQWTLPGLTLDSRAYLVIFASGKNQPMLITQTSGLSQTVVLHANFKLNQHGELLTLHNVLTGESLPLQLPQQPYNLAYGLTTNGYAYLNRPTPGQPNDETLALMGQVAPITFSPARGFYDAPLLVELQTETSEATIYYTTDGSTPTENQGQRYVEPIPIAQTTLLRAVAIKPGALPSAVNTHSYIFLDEVIKQPHDPPGWPAAWGIYNVFYPGLPVKGSPVLADYAMDKRIVTAFQETIKADMQAIPIISLVTDAENFDIYANAVERGLAWERPVSVEFFDPQRPTRQFQINAGIRMQGVSARWEFMPKKSFRLFFKAEYGATQLNYPLFEDSPVQLFDGLVLRGGANRGYAGYIDAVDYTQVTYSRDQWLRESQIAMSGTGVHGMFVHLYLNGLYWGVYNLVERPDHAFASRYFGGDKADWFAVKHGGVLMNPDEVAQGIEPQIDIGEEINGDNTRYEQLEVYLRAGRLADHYDEVTELLDLEWFSDYIILNLYGGNNDWADNNWYATSRTHPPTPLRYFVWDGEQIFNEGARLYLGKTGEHHVIRPLFLALMEIPEFQILFADRVYRNLFNDGPLTDAASIARWERINAPLAQAIVGESARWGDVRYTDNPIDQNDWHNAYENVIKQMAGNGAKLVTLLRQAGYYPTLDPPIISRADRFQKPVSSTTLTMTTPIGALYYTTDGSDPRYLISGSQMLSKTNPSVHIEPKPNQHSLILTQTTQLNARVFDGEQWSALHTEMIYLDDPIERLQITELMYHPPDNADYEFIRLKNLGNRPITLAGYYFTGINYWFPPAMPAIVPNESVLLVSNYIVFHHQFPDVAVDGIFTGRLSDAGETISLQTPSGETVVSLTYDDRNGWPISADGRGDWLIIVDEHGALNDPTNWRGSSD